MDTQALRRHVHYTVKTWRRFRASKRNMEHLELCCTLDQHEPLHSNLYAGQFTDRRRYELVAGHPHHFPRQYHCVDTDDTERACRRQIWHSLPCICQSQFWHKRRKYSGHAAGHCCLRLVWHPDLDRRLRHIPDDAGMDSLAGYIASRFSLLPALQTGPAICFFVFWLIEYV